MLTGPDSGVAVARFRCAVWFAHSTDGGRSWSDWDQARYRPSTCQSDDDDAPVLRAPGLPLNAGDCEGA